MIYLSPQEAAIADLLRARKTATWEAIETALWGDNPDGGPLETKRHIRVQVYRLRRKGWVIANWWGRGYWLISDPTMALVEGERWPAPEAAQ